MKILHLQFAAAAFLFVATQTLSSQTNVSLGTNAIIWTVPQVVRDIEQIKQQQFLAFNPHYREEKSNFLAQFRSAAKQIFVKEKAGENIQCAHQIYEDLLWQITSSADVKRMEMRLHDLESVLAATNGVKNAIDPECTA
ncbi:MAG TPA: hypothetical protein VN516_06670, partial [Candidatus Baltobacteraceae bacterium]|nr:hypothetical protein [Candidatus Baltobacteraceae bacterium]